MIRKWEFYPMHEPLVLPREAEVIYVGSQRGSVMVWTNDVIESVAQDRRPYRLQIFGTGDSPGATEKHVGSVQMGMYVWHVFRLRGGLGDGLGESEPRSNEPPAGVGG